MRLLLAGLFAALALPAAALEAPTAIGGYVAEPGDVELTDQQRMSGRWQFTRLGGTPTCAVVLTSDPDGMSGALRRTAACGPPWSNIEITRWRRYDDRIIFLDRRGQREAVLTGGPVEGFSGNARGALVGFSRRQDGQ